MTRICLALIVKDESRVIERCVASAAPFVHHVALVDTGSTDDTIPRARTECYRNGLPLAVRCITWTEFATARTELLQLTRCTDSDYSLMLDADEVITAEPGAFDNLNADAYSPCRLLSGDWELWRPTLFRNAAPWRYEGAIHNLAVCPGARVEKMRGAEITNRNDGAQGSRSAADVRNRYIRAAEHFERLLIANPSDTRAAYYAAQSWHDARQTDKALPAYERRGAMAGGFGEERYLSLLQVARYKRLLQHSAQDVEAAYYAAHESRPSRHEAMVELARWHNARGQHELAAGIAHKATATPKGDDRFLVQRSAYTWRPWLELAGAREAMAQMLQAARAYRGMLQFQNLPIPERALAEQRLRAAA